MTTPALRQWLRFPTLVGLGRGRNGGRTKLGELLPYLKAVNTILHATATRTNHTQFAEFLEFMHARADMRASDLVNAIAALHGPSTTARPTPKRAATVDDGVVEKWVADFSVAHHDIERFETVFTAFENDRGVAAATRKAVAAELTPNLPAPKSGAAANEAIRAYVMDVYHSLETLERNS